jgi:hypothetical protein
VRELRKPLTGGRTQVIRQEIDEESRNVARARVDGQRPHDRYLARKLITETQYDAAQMMLRLWDRAKMESLRAAPLEYVEPGPRELLSDAVIEAREKLHHQLARLEPMGANVVMHVACEGRSCAEWAFMRGVRREYAMERFREALQTLAGG